MEKFEVNMLGTGCPRPEIKRAGPSQVIFIGDMPILIDCGEGTTNQLMRAGIPPENINHLFFTHLHSDHTFGYGQFLFGGWELGRRELTVVGPKGLKKHHESLLNMYEEDIEYRLSLGRPEFGLLDVEIIEIEGPGDLNCSIPAKVTTAEMVHSILTYAYRFQLGSKSIVISGDTAPTDKLIELSRDADILVNDCCLVANDVYYPDNPDAEKQRVWNRISETHCTPLQAAEIASRAQVKTLVLTHFPPNIDVKEIYNEASQAYSGNIIIPDDLETISVNKL